MVETQTEAVSIQFLNGIDTIFETKNRSHPFFLKIVESSSRIIGQLSSQKKKKNKSPQSFVLIKEAFYICLGNANSQLRGLQTDLVFSRILNFIILVMTQTQGQKPSLFDRPAGEAPKPFLT